MEPRLQDKTSQKTEAASPSPCTRRKQKNQQKKSRGNLTQNAGFQAQR
jgi:hypothetical protein